MSGPARRWVAVLVALPALIWLGTIVGRQRAAAAPMTLVASTPAARAELPAAPLEVTLTWSAPPDAAQSHVAVEDAAGRPVPVGTLRTGPDTVLHVPVDGSRPGLYTLGYHVVGAAGGTATGSVRFAIGGGPVPAGPAPPVEVAHEHGVDPASAVLLLLDFVVAAGAVVLLLRRPAPRRRAPAR
jgi:methionine-rich copper-binding protein CopC